MNDKVLSFGEILLRICPDLSTDWVDKAVLPFYVGGAELNVASALALWGVPSSYLSAMPANELSTGILDNLKAKGVLVDQVILQGDRLGIYYLPKGKDVKHAGVIYDRGNSSFAQLKPEDINWDTVFDGVGWFHFSAICPAISQDVADLCLEALKAASHRGIFISLDLNYRSKLWKYGLEPIEVMPELASYCDLIMGNVWAAQRMLGISLYPELAEALPAYPKDILVDQAKITSEALIGRYDKCQYVANTFRFDYEAQGVQYFTTLYKDGELEVSAEYVASEIVDKVGSGDCFMAGLIYGVYHELGLKETLEFATAAAFDKLFVASDATNSSVADVQKRIKK